MTVSLLSVKGLRRCPEGPDYVLARSSELDLSGGEKVVVEIRCGGTGLTPTGASDTVATP